MEMGLHLASRVQLLLVATAGVGGFFALNDIASAAQMSATTVVSKVDPGSLDSSTGIAAWTAGSISVTAKRLSDGRLAVAARARIVARRPFVAQLAIAPCDAFLNPLSATPAIPIVAFRGVDIVRSRAFQKGANRLAVAGTVSSDVLAATVHRHWTDCVLANILDQAEYHAEILKNPNNALRVNTFAFRSPATILSMTTPDGQHV